MVRHHVKKKKKGGGGDAKAKKEAEEKKRLEEELGNLDRFAGSSDEEADSDGSDGDDGPGGDGEDADPAGPVEEGGRSDSEGGESADSDDDYADVYAEKMKAKDGGTKTHKKAAEDRRDDSEEEEDEQNDSDDDYNDETMPDAKSLGMANAMSRILGGQSMFQPPSDAKPASQAKPVVLSKTTTPLQRLQQKLKTEEQALRKKRQSRRAENLSAMRLPLAPTAGMSAKKLREGKRKKKRKRDDGTEEEQKGEEASPEASQEAVAVAKEIEAERTHRRIATRGVVALFNAISKHRAAAAAEATAREEERRHRAQEGYKKQKVGEEGVKTKHGFLDLIKKSAASGTAGGKDAEKDSGMSGSNVTAAKKEQGGWNALKDDFMMNSKLKDWDKEISDDDDEEVDGNDFDEASASG
ncbi:hypothetical protein ACHAXT_003806 [Thalassiosira profunda]